MAIQTRYAGDANGINNVDAKYDGTLATIVATGLTKNPTALKLTSFDSSFDSTSSATGGIVESVLRQIAIDSTVVMYQVDTSQLSVLVEATGGTTSGIQTRVRTVSGAGNVVVASTNGFKLA
jgi:hypothetical protein